MKKLFILIFLLATSTAFSQENGSATFNALRDAIIPSIPGTFLVNSERTTDSRCSYKLVFDKDGSELNRLIYPLDPGSKDFSEMDVALGGKPYTWKDRKTLFADGSQTGMSGIDVILKNSAGKFSVFHRVFDGSKPMNRKELEQLLAKISFDQLENIQ